MKILAIRGKNLASLAGEFEVNFQTGPLASSGLFAISGPTGAGKSTLLDALCVALYNETPRLSRASTRGAQIPDGKNTSLTPGDTRNLMRRGCTEALAQVDFIGNDGIAYRASWQVQRGKQKQGSVLKAVSMSLHSLPEMAEIANKLGEVKTAIVQKIGLSFEQFTRAVLLAQNEFFAFLKADDNERGELLETLSGSDIYSKISVLAYERNKQEKQTLEHLQHSLSAHSTLSEEERAQCDTQLQQARAVQVEYEAEKTALQQGQAWVKQLQQMQASSLEAEQGLLASQQALQQCAKRRDYLALVDAVQGARPLLQECTQRQQQIQRDRQQVQQELLAANQAQQEKRHADQALMQASQALQLAEQAQSQAAPQLAQAKLLDAKIHAFAPIFEQLQTDHARAKHTATAASAAWQEKQQALQALQTKQTTLDDWLQAHANQQNLAQEWPRWNVLLQQAGGIAQQLQQDQAQEKQAESQVQELRQQQQRLQQALQDSQQQRQLADAKRQTAQEALADLDGEAILAAKQVQQSRSHQLQDASKLWNEIQQYQKLYEDYEFQRKNRQTTLEKAERTLQDLRQAAPALAASLAQAEHAQKMAETACAASVERLRANLKDGQACPVCGSTDHPYQREQPELHGLLEQFQAQVQTCRQAQQENQQQDAYQLAQANTARQQLQELQLQQRDCQNHLSRVQKAWQNLPLAADSSQMFAAQYGFWLEQETLNVRTALEALSAQEKQLHTAHQAREAAQQIFDKAVQANDQQQQQAHALAQQLSQAENVLDKLRSQLASARQQLQAALHELQAMLPADSAWQQEWQAAPRAFYQQVQQQASAYLAQSQALTQVKQDLQVLHLELGNLQQRSQQAEQEAQTLQARVEQGQQQWQDLQQARQALFEGVATEQVEQTLLERLQMARESEKQQAELVQQRELQHQAAQQKAQQLQHHIQEQDEALEKAGLALQRWLAEFNAERKLEVAEDDLFAGQCAPIDTAQLQQCLQHDAQWIQQERQALHSVEQAERSAATVLKERRQQMTAHLAQRPVCAIWQNQEQNRLAIGMDWQQQAEIWLATLQQALQDQANAIQTGQQQISLLQTQLAQDDTRRQQAQQLLTEIAAQQAKLHIWASVAELIGSADGKKFRNIAQQFTLDILLGYANQHLQQLARRYHVQRIPDTLGLLVLDADMGDEMRSVHSLSGGESFLVSLALALGLASLSSSRVRVESLFIDEGFGSLDADTLRVALDALDGLQALGRKVGVITHVQEMTERIASKVLVQRSSGGKSWVSVV